MSWLLMVLLKIHFKPYLFHPTNVRPNLEEAWLVRSYSEEEEEDEGGSRGSIWKYVLLGIDPVLCVLVKWAVKFELVRSFSSLSP